LLQPPAVQPEPAKEKGVSDATASNNVAVQPAPETKEEEVSDTPANNNVVMSDKEVSTIARKSCFTMLGNDGKGSKRKVFALQKTLSIQLICTRRII